MAGENLLVELGNTVWNNFQTALPKFLLGGIILLLGIILGKTIAKIVKETLKRSKIDDWLSDDNSLNIKLSDMVGTLTKWIIYLLSLQAAAERLEITALILFVESGLSFIYGVIKASILVIVGYSLAIYLKDKIITSKSVYADMLGKAMFILIIILSVTISLPLVGIETTVINQLLIVIAASTGLGVALAFGFGMKDAFKELGKRYITNLKKKKNARWKK